MEGHHKQTKNFLKLANTNVITWNDEFKALRDANK
jgi:carotenoid cleavage dioxygenase-like enzyme